jgi:2'-5' RNA ligase
MKTNINEARYFIAILPPPDVCKEIVLIKQEISEKYRSKAALRSPPHITLYMPFRLKLKKTSALISLLQEFAQENIQFSIETEHYGAFPPRVIFIKIKENNTLRMLQKELRRHLALEMGIWNEEFDRRPFYPHITVGFRDLKKSMFAEAWHDFKKRSFQTSFEVNSISLMKHDGKQWLAMDHFLFSCNSES